MVLAISMSTLQVKVEQIEITNQNANSKLEYNYQFKIQLYLCNKLKWFSISMTKEKLENSNWKKKLKKMNWKKLKKEMPKQRIDTKIVQKILPELTEFHLQLELGTQDILLTSAIITILASGLGIGLGKLIKKYQPSKHQYQITPLYIDKNVIKLSLNCIIQVKMVHIIYITSKLLKIRRVEKHERTSNRRSYDYSYE